MTNLTGTARAIELAQEDRPNVSAKAKMLRDQISQRSVLFDRIRDPLDSNPIQDLGDLSVDLGRHFLELPILFGDLVGDYEVDRMLDGLVYLAHRNLARCRKQMATQATKLGEAESKSLGLELDDTEIQQIEERLIEAQNAEAVWEAWFAAADALYRETTGSTWLPPAGDKIALHTLTAASLSAGNWLRDRKKAEDAARFVPTDAKKIIVTGGTDYTDQPMIWATLDALHRKYGEIVIYHGGAKGTDRIAGAWANQRNMHQIVWAPNWDRDGKGAGYRRNEQLVAAAHDACLVAFPGSSGTAHLVGLARTAGIPIWTPCKTRAAAA